LSIILVHPPYVLVERDIVSLFLFFHEKGFLSQNPLFSHFVGLGWFTHLVSSSPPQALAQKSKNYSFLTKFTKFNEKKMFCLNLSLRIALNTQAITDDNKLSINDDDWDNCIL
jgi:hypothetical protein